MLAYHRGTWRKERDGPLPDVAALDALMQRYGWDYWTYQAQPQDVIEELHQVIRAEIEFRAEEDERQTAEANAQRSRQGLSPLPSRRRATIPTPRPTAELLSEARSQGFLVPEVS